MNIRSLRTMAVAGLMAMGASSSKVAAQSAAQTVKAAQEVVTKDTIKNVSGNVRDAKTILLKKYHGHFDGSVKNGKIADGSLEYAEKGKTVLPTTKGGIDIKGDAGYVWGSDLVNNGGFRLQGTAQTGNNIFGVSGLVAHKDPKTDFVAKANYTRLFPLSEDFALTGKAEVEGVINRVRGGDSFGQAWPQALVGAKYEHKFDNGVKVAAKGEAGAAFKITEKEHSYHDIPGAKFVVNGEAEVGLHRTSLFVSGGKDAVYGNNIGAGVRVDF